MPNPLSKSAIVERITNLQPDEISKRHVRSILDALVAVGHQELKSSGVFVVPGLAKLVVVQRPATAERAGMNPFTKQPIVFKAKPARSMVKARPIKAVKRAVLDPEPRGRRGTGTRAGESTPGRPTEGRTRPRMLRR